MRVVEEKKQAVVIFRANDVPPDIARKGAEVRRLLKLSPDQQRFVLVYSPGRGAEHELAVKSRSMIQIMQSFAATWTSGGAPEDHSAIPAFGNGPASDRKDVVKIRSGKHKPGSAFAAVRYRGYWFWIDDSDLQAKRELSVIQFCFTLRETGGERRCRCSPSGAIGRDAGPGDPPPRSFFPNIARIAVRPSLGQTLPPETSPAPSAIR